MLDLQSKAEKLYKERRVFLGGPIKDFEKLGRSQLIILLKNGLFPWHRVLDIGAGCLRGGYWIINFLNHNCYYAIEPNQDMLKLGLEHFVDKKLAQIKRPHFSSNDDFDFSVFNIKFNFVIARSIWTHASRNQIQQMLNSFINNRMDKGIFITSYRRSGILFREYKGKSWVGRSHKSDEGGIVYHSFRWIKNECKRRGLEVRELKDEIYNRQIWLRIE